MATDSALSVPDAVSFQQAIALSQALLEQREQGTLSETAVIATIQALVQSTNGARGFFVAYLGDDRPLIDSLIPLVAQALQIAPDVISPLMIKNLAMSTAMAITHRRKGHEDLAQGSDRVRSRSEQLLKALPLAQLRQKAEQLATSIDTGTGDYQTFLQQWGYDSEQQQAMRQALQQTGLLD